MKPSVKLRIIITQAVCLMILSTCTSAQNVTSQDTDQGRLDNFFSSIMKKYNFVAAGACEFNNDKKGTEGYYGYAELETGKHLSRENIVPFASLSKTVTAAALMKLFETGKVNIDDDINKYLGFSFRHPGYPETPVTLRMLLNHTSGLAEVTSSGIITPKNVERPASSLGDSPMRLEEYIKELLIPGGKYYSEEYFGQNKPGTVYSYSNIGYSLIGYLIEVISGRDFAEYCRSEIFKPLEMKNTGWHLRDLDTQRVIYTYRFSPEDTVPNYRKVKHFGEPGYPAGMLRSTVDDIFKFVSMIMNEGTYHGIEILKPETVKFMLAKQGMANISSRSHKIVDRCLGWQIAEMGGAEYYVMNGFSSAIFIEILFSPVNKKAVLYYYTGINMKNMAAVGEILNYFLPYISAVEM